MLALLVLLPSALSYDCYDIECQGHGYWSDKFTYCDQAYSHCQYSRDGYPSCLPGWSGRGTNCFVGVNTTYYCAHNSFGIAYCKTAFGKYMEYIIASIVLAIFLVCLCCFFFAACMKRRRISENGFVIQSNSPPFISHPPNYGTAGYAPPTDYQNGGDPALPGYYPAQPGGYPALPGGYPAQPGGYPAQPGGYPAQPGGYPAQPGFYPAQPGGYPAQPGGYPAQPGGYPAQPGRQPSQLDVDSNRPPAYKE